MVLKTKTSKKYPYPNGTKICKILIIDKQMAWKKKTIPLQHWIDPQNKSVNKNSLDVSPTLLVMTRVYPLHYNTQFYNASTIHHISQPNFLVLIYLHNMTLMLVIRHFLDLVCQIIEVINVYKLWDPQCISRFICD